MSSLSGQTVSTASARTRPQTDLERLLDYMEQRFAAHRDEILDRVADVERLQDRQDTVVLGFRTLRFIAELDGWIEIAAKQLAATRGDELGTSREIAQADSRHRASVDEVKARAAATLAPLQTVHNTLKACRDTMKGIVRFVESTQQFLRAQEFGELFSQDHEAPAELYQAPLGESLTNLRRV